MSPERVAVGAPSASVRAAHLVELDGREPADAALARLLERAFAAGAAAGEAQAREGSARALDEAAARLEAFRQEAAERLARTSVELALELARHLLHAEVNAGNFDLEKLVRETLHAASAERGSCVVHVHPEDAAALAGVRFRAGTTIQGDVGVSRGDVHVECRSGLMVRELDGALRAIGERLREEWR